MGLGELGESGDFRCLPVLPGTAGSTWLLQGWSSPAAQALLLALAFWPVPFCSERLARARKASVRFLGRARPGLGVREGESPTPRPSSPLGSSCRVPAASGLGQKQRLFMHVGKEPGSAAASAVALSLLCHHQGHQKDGKHFLMAADGSPGASVNHD